MTNSSFYITRRVEFHETDAAGLMHFSNYYRWMEVCEHEWFRTKNLQIIGSIKEGSRYGWPRREASCSFMRALRLGDLVRVSAIIKKINDTSLNFNFVFEKDRSGKWTKVAEGYMTTIHVKQHNEGLMEAEPFPTSVNFALMESSNTPNKTKENS